MRTTLTLDADLARALRRLAHDTSRPFKAVVNEVIRAGLARGAAPPRRRYRVKPQALGGVRSGVDLDKALRLADALEDEGAVRKLEMRK
ncbi:MAG: hypothetical protein U0Q12_08415 [Vicinamibacterales bacterium]